MLEFDDLRVRVEQVTDAEIDERMALARRGLRASTRPWQDEDFALGAPASRSAWTGWSRTSSWTPWPTTTAASRASSTSGWAPGMILGASLLTARGIPAAGEYELRTSLAMLIVDRLGAGGSFTELQALNFHDDVVEMGHDGPAHLAISSRRPLLRGLGVYHGKRGWGVSVEFDVTHGPVTAFGLAQQRDGTFGFVASEGTVVPARCCRSATPPRASTSAAIRASGPTRGARPASRITGRSASATSGPISARQRNFLAPGSSRSRRSAPSLDPGILGGTGASHGRC